MPGVLWGKGNRAPCASSFKWSLKRRSGTSVSQSGSCTPHVKSNPLPLPWMSQKLTLPASLACPLDPDGSNGEPWWQLVSILVQLYSQIPSVCSSFSRCGWGGSACPYGKSQALSPLTAVSLLLSFLEPAFDSFVECIFCYPLLFRRWCLLYEVFILALK